MKLPRHPEIVALVAHGAMGALDQCRAVGEQCRALGVEVVLG